MNPAFAFAAAHAIGAVASHLRSVAGPAPNAGWAKIRAEAGIPDPTVVRSTEQFEQLKSVSNRGTISYANTLQGVHDLIRMFHQAAPLVGQNGEIVTSPVSYSWLKNRLAMHGVDLSIPGEVGAPGIAIDWLNLVAMEATAAPLERAVRAWHRNFGLDDDAAEKWRAELDFHFRRDGVSRNNDRELLTNPYASFSTLDAERLGWLGFIDDFGRKRLYRADGVTRPEDEILRRWLHVKLPPPQELYVWAQRNLWNKEIALEYNLDFAFENSPVAIAYAKRQGEGVRPENVPGFPELPGAGEDETDWVKLSMRAQARWPTFHEVCEMQRRLRPLDNNNPNSVVPGVLAWTEQNTKDALKVHGYSPPLANRMMGLVYEPLNIRIINHVLFEALRFPEIAREVEQVTQPGTDWVTNAFLDHGFTPPISRLAANAIRKTAEERYYTERNNLQEKIRRDSRDMVLHRYGLGLYANQDAAVVDLVGKYVTREMAFDLLGQVDLKIRTEFVETATKEVKAAFMEGKLTVEQAGAQLQVLGVNDVRRAFYIQEWVWQKNDRQRMLSTTEIIHAAKSGIMTPAVALARLVNLGWTAPDAMVELALAQHEIDVAAAKVANANAAKVIAANVKAQHEQAAAKKAQDKLNAAAAKAAKKLHEQEEEAPLHEVMAETKYDATALINLNAWTKADAAGDENKAASEIAKAAHAYTELLLTQLKLKRISPKVASEIQPVEPVAVPPLEANPGTGAGATSPAPQPGAASTNSGGTGNP